MADQIFIACHGPLASALKEAAELIVGADTPIIAAEPYIGDFSAIDNALKLAFDRAGTEGRVFAVTDLLGGSVNTHLALCKDRRLTLITGANLGLIIELAVAMRGINSESLRKVISTARSGICLVELVNDPEEEDFS